MPIIRTVVVGPLQTNCYLVADEATRECAIIDPGGEEEKIAAALDRDGLKPAFILLTHAHFDHIGAVEAVKRRYGIRVGVSPIEARALGDALLSGAQIFGFPFTPTSADFTVSEGHEIRLGETIVKALETPGHSPGGVSYLGDGFVVVGDVLFRDGIGRYDLPGSDARRLAMSLERLLGLEDDVRVYPGHGPMTTIGRERTQNPHLSFMGLTGEH